MEKPTPIMPEAQSLYKERMSSAGYLEQKLAEIKAVAEGEPLFDKLTEAEKAELLTEEDVYGERLEGLVQANIRTVRLVLSYFKTEEGKATLKAFTKSEDIPEDDEGLKIFFLQNADVLSQMNGEDRDELTNSASVYENKRLRDSLLSGATDDGKLAITNQEASERLTINLDPEKSLTKIDGLRALKQEIKGKLAEVREMDQDPLAESKALIYEMYLSRINISIAGTEAPRTGLREKARLLGVDSLNEAEKRLLGINSGEVQQKSQDEADRINARYDKFIYGASPDYREGWQQQVC
jgi:hypothetical protein